MRAAHVLLLTSVFAAGMAQAGSPQPNDTASRITNRDGYTERITNRDGYTERITNRDGYTERITNRDGYVEHNGPRDTFTDGG